MIVILFTASCGRYLKRSCFVCVCVQCTNSALKILNEALLRLLLKRYTLLFLNMGTPRRVLLAHVSVLCCIFIIYDPYKLNMLVCPCLLRWLLLTFHQLVRHICTYPVQLQQSPARTWRRERVGMRACSDTATASADRKARLPQRAPTEW